MKKIYLSREMSRAMAFDHPVGDPTGGPAYGEKRDPISAAISVGTMLFTAEAAFAGSIMAGVAFGGAAISLVGNITGNKTLSQVGMVAGLIGGAGMAGMFGEAAQGATWGSAFGGEAAAAQGAAPLASTPTPEAAAAPGAQTPVVEGAPTATTPTGQPVSANPVQTPAQQSLAETLKAPTVDAPAANLTSNPAADWKAELGLKSAPEMSYAPGQAPSERLAQMMKPGFSQSLQAGNFGDAASAAWDNVKGFGKDAMDLAKSNPGAAYMMGQAAGGVANWLSGKTDAEINAMQAQTGYADARAQEIQAAIQKEKTRRANLNAGYTSVNTALNVNPNAGITQPWQQQQAGLIAGARG